MSSFYFCLLPSTMCVDCVHSGCAAACDAHLRLCLFCKNSKFFVILSMDIRAMSFLLLLKIAQLCMLLSFFLVWVGSA